VDYYNNDLTDKDEFGINAKKFLNQQVSVEGRVGLVITTTLMVFVQHTASNQLN
jgi:hypothetical protein